MESPDIFEYLDVHHFLLQVYAYRRSVDAKYSYGRWAKDMGIKDRSYLRQLVIGERSINADVKAKFCTNLALAELELQYFVVLVEYSATDDEVVRDKLGKTLIGIIKQKETV